MWLKLEQNLPIATHGSAKGSKGCSILKPPHLPSFSSSSPPPPPLQSFIVASHWVFYSYQAYTMSIHDHNVLLFCTLFISGIPFSRDWSYNVCGGDLLCIFVACYPRVQHTLGCLSFDNSSLAFDQHCFSLF